MSNEILDRTTLKQMQAIFEMGFNRCAEATGLLKPHLSLSEARRKYGRGTLERWVSEGLVTIHKDGPGNCRCRIERKQIELVAAMSNRASWYEHHAE